MNSVVIKTLRKATLFILLFVPVIAILAYFLYANTGNTEVLEEARQLLPGYTIVFEGHTNEIQRCGSPRAFSRQHEMMEYLQIFAPYLKTFTHPKNNPIYIFETEDRIIIELPCKYLFEPYNWKIFWGGAYNFRLEIDKKTKKVLKELIG